MPDIIQLHDKKFKKFISSQEIQKAIKKVARQINRDFDGKNPVFVCVLNGAFMFSADLLKHITVPCEITFVKVASYEGENSTGKVKTLIGLKHDISEREIVIVEDIVDTGQTIEDIIDQIKQYMPEDVHVATLLYKPEAYTKDIPIEYVALEVPNDFLVGYGLDYNEQGRNLTDIYAIVKEEEKIQA